MTPKHSANSVKAKARKRLAEPPPEYWDRPDTSKPVRRLIYEDLLTNERHEFVLFISPHRIDQFRVELDGREWKQQIGWSRVLAGLRKAAGRFGNLH